MTAIDRKLRREAKRQQRGFVVPVSRARNEIRQINVLSREVLMLLEVRGWPNARLITRRAGWSVATYTYWSYGEHREGDIYLLSNGSFARNTTIGGFEVFSLRSDWVRSYDAHIVKGLNQLKASLI